LGQPDATSAADAIAVTAGLGDAAPATAADHSLADSR
jgi:hypothetical protein